MIPVINQVVPGVFTVNPSAMEELLHNNCTMPNVENVVYNLKTEDTVKNADGTKSKVTFDKPILTTVVFFVDGTKAVVQNSANDAVKTVAQKLSDGSTVMVADQEAKERGLLYAIVKRYVSDIDEKGNAVGGGLGNILRNVVKAAYDPRISNAEGKIRQAASAKRHAEQQANAKPKVKRHSIAETLARFNAVLDKVDVDPSRAAAVADVKSMLGL